MAHNLMKGRNGLSAYVGAKELAWHKLGVTTKEVMTSKEAIELAQLDYIVGIQPLYANIPKFINNEKTGIVTPTPILTHNVTYNTENGHVFGVVGQRYEVIQNHEAFDFLDGIVKEKVAMFETAGALGMGETIFITVKLPKNVRLNSNKNEEISSYLLFTSSHDGSGSIQVGFTPIRVVCNNTLNAALNGLNMNNSWSIKHTKNARNRLINIQNLFKTVDKTIDKLGLLFSKMEQKILSDVQVEKVLIKAVLSKDEYIIENDKAVITTDLSTRKLNLIYQLNKSIYKGVGQDLLIPNSAYHIYNGITNYLQNSKSYKTDDDMFKNINQKNNLSNKVFNELTLIGYDN